ncbi:MAG: hypothetical protein ABI080_03770 [Candidatus Binatia bacterium]
MAASHPAGAGAAEVVTTPSREGPELFGVESPLGHIDYRAGRGLHLGATTLTIGGYTTADAERLEDGSSRGGLDVNFFLSADPVSFLHLFSEIEVGELVDWEGGGRPHASPKFKVERLYGDATWSDGANLRFGKFLLPFGRWNQVLADPLLWTTSEPLIVEEVFHEEVTGAMLWGNVFPGGETLSYALYGSFLDRAVSEAEHDGVGARLEWTSRTGVSVGASYLASKRTDGAWNHLGGVDAFWQPHERVELSGEALVGEGAHADGGQWGLYAQAVVETIPTVYLIGRYERFNPPAGGRGIDLFDLGVAWVPTYYLRFKVDYRFADELDDRSAPGVRASFSVLF